MRIVQKPSCSRSKIRQLTIFSIWFPFYNLSYVDRYLFSAFRSINNFIQSVNYVSNFYNYDVTLSLKHLK